MSFGGEEAFGEKMIEETVEIDTDDGLMTVHGFCPDELREYPAVILYMDASGIREELKNMSRQITSQGYFCLLPDLYHRLGTIRFDPERRDGNRDDAMKDVVTACRLSLNNAGVMRDTKGMLAYLDGHERVRKGAKGCIGYCMSGQNVVSAIGTFPEHFQAGAALYGVGVVTEKEDSPHLLAGRMKGELYFGFAEVDDLVPDNVIPDLEAALKNNGIAYECKVFPGTRHGFCFEERAVYNRDAATEVWEKAFALFKRRLG
jgi:carboxymethylenebutenolidase